MELPEPVLEHLRRDYVIRTRPFCFLIDSNFVLLEAWGDASWCALDNLEPGACMLDQAPYLYGSIGDEPRSIDFVSIGAGAVAHVHIIPQAEKWYVALLDASAEHDSLQRKQQAVNELRLLHASQQKLIARQRDLISELVEAKAELDHHRREAERGSAAKGRFIAMMSHEFRTPLASIINYAELALEEGVAVNDVRKSLEAITRSGRHLTALVEAVLDEARLEAGQITLRERDFSLYELVDDLSAMMAPLAAEKALSYAALVDPDVPERIRADDVCLRQILVNLLGNAVKYTEEGAIRLTITYNDERLLATVTDTGPGIGPEDQERVFKAFERGEHGGGSGAGLGLTITLRLAQLMGGEVTLDSIPGQGCTVGVHVPVARPETADDVAARVFPAPSEDNLATRPTSVLICDDDEDMRALVEYYLHRAGYGLITTADGREAVEKALAYRPDLVLMDVNVPGVSGIDAAKTLRMQGYAGPIVALTASRLSEEDAARFSLCFRKPAPMQELLGQIKRLTHSD